MIISQLVQYCVPVFFLFPLICYSDGYPTKYHSHRLPLFDFDQESVTRIGFDNSSSTELVLLLQDDGIVDTVQTFSFVTPTSISTEDVYFIQLTSDSEVLDLTDATNILVSSSASGVLNITCTLTFDGMVGIVRYTLLAMSRSAQEELSRLSISFLIVGMTFYRELPTGDIEILSGEGNQLSISYQQAMSLSLSWQTTIKVFIQYANGTSSDVFLGSTIPQGDSLQMTLTGLSGQIVHNTTTCELSSVGSQLLESTFQLPDGCGCGFYYGSSNMLLFGFLFQPYRVGAFTVRFLWIGLTTGYIHLSGESFELSLNVIITGDPPLAVVGIAPSTSLLRPEGGEIRTLFLVNVHLHEAVSFEIRVAEVTKPFKMIAGTFETGDISDYVDSISFLTESGSGIDLSWSLYFQTINSSLNGDQSIEAVFAPSFIHSFSYDTANLSIESMEPMFGSEDGGEIVTLTGYFSFFNVSQDCVCFSGYRLDKRYIISATQRTIVFYVPARILLGSSFEYRVTVNIGFSSSNYVLYSYYLTYATMSFRLSGLSEVTQGTYRLGNCSYAQFTVTVTPYTNQIRSYQWSLFLNGDSDDLLRTEPFQDVNSSAQTIILRSEMMELGLYTLRVETTLMTLIMESEIVLVREDVMVIGVMLLPINNQTLSSSDSPLQATAIVQHPECFYGNNTMIFEWSALGYVEQFSSDNVSTVSTVGFSGSLVTRLGWEYTISKENVTVGTHEISFRAWFSGEETIFGRATTLLNIGEGSLVAVIRSGETNLTVNYLSILRLYGNWSYDSGDLDQRHANLTYEWQCRQSNVSDFSLSASLPCLSSLIPDSTASDFVVPISLVQAEENVRFLQFSLSVRKGSGKFSEPRTLIVEIQDHESLPSLDAFNISVTNADGGRLDWNQIPYYEDIIIQVESTLNSSWTYDLIEPRFLAFFTEGNLINHTSFYSPLATISGHQNKREPLGIQANALDPSTTYVFRILFEESPLHAGTNVTFEIRTLESAVVHSSMLAVTEITTTEVTAIAGVASFSSQYSYYFTVTDSTGYEYCAGGCTGHDLSYFKITRSESYTMSTYVCDAQGRTITSETSSQTMTVTESDHTIEQTEFEFYQAKQDTLTLLYKYGNDQQWLQLAHEVSITMIEGFSINSTMNISTEVVDGWARERQLATQMDMALNIANYSSKMYCNSYPNTLYGQDCIKLTNRISQLGHLDLDTVYFLMQTATCCIKNTPKTVLLSVINWLPDFISQLNRLTRNLNHNGNSRRRLLQYSGMPANPVADVQVWTGEVIAYASALGKVNGFTEQYIVGDDNNVGHVSVAVASKSSDLPTDPVNGIIRNIIKGPSANELFYPRDSCFERLFSIPARKRILVFYTTDNFILLGFQDPPLRSNLVDRLYWTQIYEIDDHGLLHELPVRHDGFCYCWRLPVVRLQEELASSLDDMPGLFGVTDIKTFREDVTEKGEVFNYEYDNSKTSEYNTSEGWVEGCRIDVGLVSTTVVSKREENIVADNLSIIGLAAWGVAGLIVGGLLLVIVAIISSWLVAVRAMSVGEFSGDGEAYVERDVYGRGTGLEGNVIRVRSGE